MKKTRLHQSTDTKTIATDRFLDLPEPIIHHIVSFLPTKDARKTCGLSKRFRSAWKSFPIINFDLKLDFNSGHNDFLNFVRDSLQRRTPNVSLQKFRLHTEYANSEDERINNAIRFAIENNVNDLDLDFYAIRSRSIYYDLPLYVFFVKSIKFLKLKSFKLETPELNISFPSIEYLSFIGCNIGVDSFRVSCPNLKIMVLDSCGGLEKIDVVASNLESFSYTGMISKNSVTNIAEVEPCKINIAASKSPMNLSLKKATITGEWLKNHVSKFCLLELLRLSDCVMLKNLYFSSDSLKTLEIKECGVLETIDVVALNLETFVYDGGSKQCDQINIIACRFLKNLSLHRANITDQWIKNNVSEFPFLENLKLSSCNVMQKFMIFHEELKSLKLLRCNKLEEVEVDARSIVSFEYSGNLMPSRLLIDSPHLCAKLSVNTDAPTHDWFKKFMLFLGGFDHCKELTIASVSEAETIFIVPREVREDLLPPLFDIKHLKVEVRFSSKNITNLVESLLWITPHLDTISIISDSREKSIKFHYAKPVTDEEDLFCCWSRPVKCWRHYLNEVRLENFEDVEHTRLKDFFIRNTMRLETFRYTSNTQLPSDYFYS